MIVRRSGSEDRTWLVALAACCWGLSALWRHPLAREYPAITIVFWEHVLLTLLALPWLVPAGRRLLAASLRTKVSVLVIGAGSSALATVLFTSAFRLGDPVTPQVLQKLQPVIALALAALVLGERLRYSYFCFAAPAVIGAWLLAFPQPLDASVSSAMAALLALGAAALWGAGTVLGRAASAELGFSDLTALRFSIGLVTLAVTAWLTGTPLAIRTDAVPNLVPLALVSGFLALVLYYSALGRTPAARATLAELAFPLTAAVVGVAALGARLAGSQWVGFTIVLGSVVALALHEQSSRRPLVRVPDRADEALARRPVATSGTTPG